MNQQVKKELKSQVTEKRYKELMEKQAKMDDENLNNIVNSIQLTDEFTKEVIKQ